jgi:hypothetical protein
MTEQTIPTYEIFVESTNPLILKLQMLVPNVVYLSFEEGGGFEIGEFPGKQAPAMAFLNHSRGRVTIDFTVESQEAITHHDQLILETGPSHEGDAWFISLDPTKHQFTRIKIEINLEDAASSEQSKITIYAHPLRRG